MHREILLSGICLLATGLTSVWSAHGSGKWSYLGATGPSFWHEIFPDACSGKNQSPIDLKSEETLYNSELKDFAIWYDPPRPDSKMFIKNTGYTLQVDLQGDFLVTNAGLGHVYKAVQFHFHWGHKSHQGSEHLLESVASPIEMHVVTFNRDVYSDVGEAVPHPGGLAVLGVLFEISKEDNPNFDYIIRAMKYIRNPEMENGAKVELPLFSLRDLLPDDIRSYFRYNGSLTTPGCFESVIWTVFKQKQTISHKQMEQFRKLLQYKRRHHHHHDKDGNRQKREVTNTLAEKEKNAAEVLDELGLHGKDSGFEREVLRNELTKANNAVESEMGNPAEGGDQASKVEPTEHTYVQDYIVNNFRPVQPLNDRIVFRSFKLREVVVISQYDSKAEVVKTQKATYDGNDNHNGANTSFVSLTLMLLSFIIFAIKNLH